jgi:hypothetical protein
MPSLGPRRGKVGESQRGSDKGASRHRLKWNGRREDDRSGRALVEQKLAKHF